LQEKLKQLEQQLTASSSGTSLSSEQCASGEDINELKKKIQSQVTDFFFKAVQFDGLYVFYFIQLFCSLLQL